MTGTAKRLLLIDGHSMAYRAFFALPVDNFKTSEGQPTNAVYGFASMLINLIKEEKPTHIAIAFDVSRKTFRTEKFPEYKANRASTPDEFRSQMSHINEMVDCFAIRHFELPGFEADDIIATFAKKAETQGFEVLICTGDRDSFQLVNDKTTVLYPKKGVTEMSRMTPTSVFEKYGLTPTQYPDFAALRGDPSDNLPSVPGVGEKTATKWIADYGSLTNLLKHAGEISGKVGESLRANIESIKLNRELTHLLENLDLSADISDLDWSGFDADLINKFFEKLEIKALRERIKSLPQKGQEVIKEIPIQVRELKSEELDVLLAKHNLPIAIAFHFLENRLQEYSVALSANEVILVRSEKIGKWIEKQNLQKYVHGAKPPIKILGMLGLNADVELLAYLVNPGSRNLGLLDLAERLLGVNTNVNDLFFDFDPLAASWIFQIHSILQSEIDSKGMSSLYVDLEQPTLLLLASMEEVGIGVDGRKLSDLSKHFYEIVSQETQ